MLANAGLNHTLPDTIGFAAKSLAESFLLPIILMQQAVGVLYEDLEYAADPNGDGCAYFFKGGLYSGVAVERFSDGVLRCEFPFINGLEHGEVKEYYHSGRLKASQTYVNGRVLGQVREWFENGILKKDEEFGKLGKLWSRTFDESGNVESEYFATDI